MDRHYCFNNFLQNPPPKKMSPLNVMTTQEIVLVKGSIFAVIQHYLFKENVKKKIYILADRYLIWKDPDLIMHIFM